MKVAHTRSTATFGQAFSAARAAKCDEFVWRGGTYHTRREADPKPVRPVEPVIERIEDTDALINDQ